MDNNQNPKEFHLYSDIRERTGGEIYIGVVGPVSMSLMKEMPV